MKTFSMDLRDRVAGAYDAGEGTMAELAERFKVSYWWVKKILRLRRETGSMNPVGHRGGRRPTIDGADIERLKHLLEDSPDLTLAQIREALGVSCSTVAVHYTLKRLGYRRIKKLYAPVSRIAPR
jgi:transposase